MSEMVGFTVNLKVKWLNKTVELLSENLSEEEFKKQINEYLGYEIKSQINIRKTRELLMHLWYYQDSEISGLRRRAIDLLNKDNDNAILCHWGLMLCKYPVFKDICQIIGKLSEFEDEITLQQIRQKLFDTWGERATVNQSLTKTIATMKNFGVLEITKPGRYRIVKREVEDQETTNYIVDSVLLSEDKNSIRYEELKDVNYMFPFKYHLRKEYLMMDKDFVVDNIAGEIMIGIA